MGPGGFHILEGLYSAPAGAFMTNQDRTDTHDDASRMTLGEHLEELRGCLIRALIGLVLATALSFVFSGWLLALLRDPFDRALADSGAQGSIVVTNVTAGFMTYIRVSVISGLILSGPWIFYQLWRFISTGLYPHERRSVLVALPFASLLFAAGALTFLFFVSYPTLYFFLSFNKSFLGTESMIRLDEHIAFMTTLMLVFGLAFQTPMVQYILARTGLVTSEQFGHYRKHAVVGILILAAVVTSPSPIDQLGLGLPMYLLFELGIQLARLGDKQHRRAEQEIMEG